MTNFHSILDRFEAEWAQPVPPDLARYVTGFAAEMDATSKCELIKIDLERRWRHEGGLVPRYLVERYLFEMQLRLTNAELIDLLAWEYAVRNRWGDCPTRTETIQRFPSLALEMAPALRRAGEEIAWPRLTLECNRQIVADAPMDDVVEIGRQRSSEPAPYAILDHANGRRWIVAAADNPNLSRTQLHIRLVAPTKVSLRNCSTKRALAITDEEPLDAGMSRTLRLPVQLHLWEAYFLRICERSARFENCTDQRIMPGDNSLGVSR